MSEFTLFVGDKNVSSWSLRPWLAMKTTGIAFREIVMPLDRPTTAKALSQVSPSGLVPSLSGDGLVIWDSLAILEYLAETFPEKRLWPADKKARARARSIAAEMHSGFAELRHFWPMNFSRIGLRHLCPPPVRREVDCAARIWVETRAEFGKGGPYLFGDFSIADAMFAPVVSRFMSYGPVELPPTAAAYRDMIFALPAMKEWGEAAAREVSEGN